MYIHIPKISEYHIVGNSLAKSLALQAPFVGSPIVGARAEPSSRPPLATSPEIIGIAVTTFAAEGSRSGSQIRNAMQQLFL